MANRYLILKGDTRLWKVKHQNSMYSVLESNFRLKIVKNSDLEIAAQWVDVERTRKSPISLRLSVINEDLFREHLIKVEKQSIVSEAEQIANGLA